MSAHGPKIAECSQGSQPIVDLVPWIVVKSPMRIGWPGVHWVIILRSFW